MLEIDRAASVRAPAPAERCLAVLTDVCDWPRWSRLVRSVEPVGDAYRLRAEILGLGVEMTCVLDETTLRRIADGPEDRERFEMAWTVGDEVTLHVRARLDAPGPASLLRRRVERALADDVLADFAAAL